MKKFILSIIVMAFAVAVQADDAKTCPAKDKDKPSCCPGKAKAGEQAKEGTCPFAKKEGCKAKTEAAKQSALQSPKAAEANK
jgi:hypothetical protein